MKRRQLAALAVIILGWGTAVVFAHHSLAAEFDESKPLTLQGFITKVEWINPHVYVHLDVKDSKGTTEAWALETLPPATLRRGGLRKEMLGAGEAVTILAYHARKATNLAFLRKITFADGKEIVVWVGDIKQAR